MILRTFTASTMSEAMSLVRARLGADAIIVSTEEDETGATRVTAAVERSDRPLSASEPDVIDLLNEALNAHGLAPTLIEKILCAALPFETDDPLLALAGALTSLYRFAPIESEAERPLLLVGPPGAGKTLSIAKLAARAVMAGAAPRLVTTDTVRAGAVEQLAAFARVLGLPLHRVDSPQRLGAAVAAKARELVLIDSAGINPYNAGDRRELTQLIASSGAEPVLVLPAGGDPLDTVDMARIFRDLGCARAIVTRLDMVQRLSSVVTVIDTLDLGLSEASLTPEVANGLAPFNAVVLARLLLPKPAREQQQVGARRSAP
jgi:flagellar biosynthesis protein FlhF